MTRPSFRASLSFIHGVSSISNVVVPILICCVPGNSTRLQQRHDSMTTFVLIYACLSFEYQPAAFHASKYHRRADMIRGIPPSSRFHLKYKIFSTESIAGYENSIGRNNKATQNQSHFVAWSLREESLYSASTIIRATLCSILTSATSPLHISSWNYHIFTLTRHDALHADMKIYLALPAAHAWQLLASISGIAVNIVFASLSSAQYFRPHSRKWPKLWFRQYLWHFGERHFLLRRNYNYIFDFYSR